MDLIYIILSVLLRLSPVALNLSELSRQGKRRHNGTTDLAMWLPFFGWVSVSVQFMPSAKWLIWQVTDVRSLDRTSLDSGSDGWGKPRAKRGKLRSTNHNVPD